MKYIGWLEEKNIYYKILYIFYAIISVTCIKEIPYLTSIFSIIMVILSFIYFCIFIIKGYYVNVPKVRYILLTFLIIQVSSFFISNNYISDFMRLVFNTIYFFIISININKNKDNDINKIFNYIINIIFPIVIVSLITYWFKIKFIINDNIYGRLDSYEGANKTFAGITVNINTLGILCSILIILSLNLLITKKQSVNMKIYLAINILIALISLFYTKARGAMLMLVVYIFCMIILSIKSRLKVITISLITGICAYIFVDKLIIMEGMQKLSTGRSLLWSVAAKVIKENPLFGVGTTAFVDVVKNSTTEHLPGIELGGLHNIYIQIATANGCIALALFLIFIFSIIILGIKKVKIKKVENNTQGISLLSIIISFLALGLVESTLIYIMSFIALIFWVCIGYLIDIIETK